MKSWRHTFVALLIFASWGCAQLATVRTTEPRVPTIAASEDKLTLAKQHLAAAERAQPLVALGNDLSAAKVSLNVLEQRPKDLSAQSIYNFSVARAVENLERAKLHPWQRKIDINRQYTLTTPKPIDQEHDPSRYDLFPVDTLKIGGTFFKTHSAVKGVGAPLVAVARQENPKSREQFKLRRIYAPVTAVIRFSDKRADLDFVDPMKVERVAIGKRNFPLAIDLSAPTAMFIARERPERLGFSRVIDPQNSTAAVRSKANAGDFCSRLAGNGSELGSNDRHAPQ